MIHAYVAQWAGEAVAVIASIDLEAFSADAIPAMDFVAVVAADLGVRHVDARILLCAGGAIFEPGAVAALDEALDAEPSLGVATACLDGEPYPGVMNPHGSLVREGFLPQWGFDNRLVCYAWEQVLAYRMHRFARAGWPSGIAHVAAANMRTLHDDARAVALGNHYYDQLADNERAEAIMKGRL